MIPNLFGKSSSSTYEVPAGHHQSDLSNEACNIALGRLRDVTLREDIKLETTEGKMTLRELFKGKRSVIIGIPDGGKVCSEQHVPGYLEKFEEFKKHKLDKMYCMFVGSLEDS